MRPINHQPNLVCRRDVAQISKPAGGTIVSGPADLETGATSSGLVLIAARSRRPHTCSCGLVRGLK